MFDSSCIPLAPRGIDIAPPRRHHFRMSDRPLPRLLPAPRRIEARPGSWSVPTRASLFADPGCAVDGDDDPGLARLGRALGASGRELWRAASEAPRADVLVRRRDDLAPEAYRLELGAHGALLEAGDAAGTYYGLSTLAQLLEGLAFGPHVDALGALLVEDAPDFPERGVTLDVARDKRPTLATLFDLVRQLSSWKLNRLQLYMEADFAYEGCEEVLAGRSPYTPAELRELDAFCRAHHVELVPNQQSFGHMHHWLRHERWRHLAEVPEGIEHPFSRAREPFSLAAVEPRVLEFLGSLYDQLLPCFASETLNVGLDETYDLGWGRSKAACEERGTGRVYLEFLQRVHELASSRGRRIQFWGDVVVAHPELIDELPRDATAMVWGYEADFPFEERLPAFARSGLEFQVCPGTSSWNSFGGRTTNALGNLQKAAREGLKHGARGLLITDWGDRGHLQTWPTSLFGFALGAACAWNVAASQALDMDAAHGLLDRFVFEDESGCLSRAARALGTAGDALGDGCENGHALFFALTFALDAFPHPRIVGVTESGLDAVREQLAGALEGLDGARSRRADAELLVAELELARDLLVIGERLLRARRALPAPNRLQDLGTPERGELRTLLAAARARQRELWPRRFRPGGLASSLRWLEFLEPG